jgi:hypothetical protein
MSRVHATMALCLLAAGCVPHGSPDSASSPPDAGAESAATRSARSREHIEALAPLPESALAGGDANRDHIRDDVEQYIDDAYGDRDAVWLAARQYARAEQQGVVFAHDVDRAQDAGDEITQAIECLYAFLPADDADAVWKELQVRTLDDDDRASAYFALQDALAGGYFASSPERKDACGFDTTGLQP